MRTCLLLANPPSLTLPWLGTGTQDRYAERGLRNSVTQVLEARVRSGTESQGSQTCEEVLKGRGGVLAFQPRPNTATKKRDAGGRENSDEEDRKQNLKQDGEVEEQGDRGYNNTRERSEDRSEKLTYTDIRRQDEPKGKCGT